MTGDESNGGGVYIEDRGTFKVSGTPVISGNMKGSTSANNVELGGKTISVNGALTSGAEIHVNAGLGVPIAEKGGDRTTALTETEAGYFKSDVSSDLLGGLNDAGQVVFKEPLPALTAPANLTYNGTEQTPALTFEGATLTADEDYTVSYKKVAGGTETEISGAPKDAGTYKAVAAGKGRYAGTSEAEFTIARKEVTVSSGIAANNKTYDGTTAATLDTTGAQFDGICDGDSLTVSGTGTFDNASAVSGKTVTISDLILGGTSSGNYVLASGGNQSETKATINKKKLTITGVTAADKEYDGNTTAATDTSKATVTGLVDNESVTFTVSGSFADANNGENKTVTLFNWTLTNGGENYEIDAASSQPTAAANIIRVQVYITGITAENKVYDGNKTATVSGAAVLKKIKDDSIVSALSISNITAEFADKNVRDNKAVTITGGTLSDAENYILIPGATTGLTANITPKPVTITGLSAKNKVYDTTTAATVTGTAVINGKVGNDDVTVSAGTAAFDNANVSDNKTITFKSYSLTGEDASNYTLSAQPENVTANITKRKVTVTALEQTVSINGAVDGSVDKAQLTGAVAGHELASVSLNADTSVKTNNGTLSVSGAVIVADGVDVTANYDVSYVDGRLVVLLGEAATVTTAPSAKTLSYNGAAQELVSANAVVSGGSIVYALKSGTRAPSLDDWKNVIPTGTDAKEYRVWYMVLGDDHHDDSEADFVDVTIAKRAVTITAKDQTVSLNGTIDNSVSMAELSGEVEGDTLVSVILTGSSTEHVTTSGVISADTAVINSGSKNVTSNYSITYADGTLSVNAVEAVVTEAPAALNPVYNAEAQKLVSNNAIAEGGDILYTVSSNGTEAPAEGFSAEIPTGTDAGVYHVWYMAAGDDDHLDSDPACMDVTIDEAEYSIIYHANDGSGAVVSKNEAVGSAEDRATISSNAPDREGYIFDGWNDAEDGSGKLYANGDEYTPVQNEDKSFADFNLYAQWRAVSLDSISINTAPAKTEYFEGESFDPSGMVIIATYTDGTEKEVSTYSYDPSGKLTVSDDHITVSYTEEDITCTADQEILVIPIELDSISINTAPSRTKYEEGDVFDPSGMVVIASYNNNDTRVVEDYSFIPDGKLTVSDDHITVIYTENGIACLAEQKISVEYKKDVIEEDEEYFMWNLYEDSTPKELKVQGVSGDAAIKNSNAKSSAFYDATLSGNIITVSVKGDLKEAAKEANAVLEFKTADGEIIEYSLPVEYKKPALKLSTTSVTIKRGTETAVKTTVLYKTAGGNFEPLELRGGTVTFAGQSAEIEDNGVIVITAKDAQSGKISILGEGWNAKEPIELKFNIKATDKDVISVDLGGVKNVIVNKNAKGQKFEFPVYLNGVAAGDDITISDKNSTGLASYENGVLTVAYPEGKDLKAKTYTITLSKGNAKTDVKIRVSDKELSKSISLKIQSRYDVVTGQKMVIVSTLKEVGGEIEAVSVSNKDFHAVLNDAGNIIVDYEGNSLNTKNLKIGDMSFKLKLSGVEDEISVTLKNVKAKKSAIKVKAAKVSMGSNGTAVANLVCSYKDASGDLYLIAPENISIKSTKNVKAEVGEDKTAVTVSNLTRNSGNVKLTLTFRGGVTKNVTVKVKK
ncbi:MAG: InlB B-repeat-containing protein [Lachnospiraceae bacterium]|nr:InlB B-repeat-containing protein [Lachnospiraceae bacterium]